MGYVEDCLLLMSERGYRMTAAMLAVVGDEALVSNASITTLITLHRDGPLRPNRIAALTGLTSGGANKLITRLERGGLVARQPGIVPDDGRAVVVLLTDSGAATAEEIVVASQPHIDALIDGLITVRTNTE